jgi:peptidyl-prolyl cis-trans isomerase D
MINDKHDTGLTVRASHILIPNDGPLPDGSTTITDSIMALAKATELYNQVKGGANIAELASKFSTDQGSASNGGDLGWKGVNGFVKPFANFCKSATKGQVGLVKSQFGYHIIKMMEEPSNILVKYSENIIPITPGNETVKRVAKASREFKSTIGSDAAKFDKTQEQQGLIPRLVRDIQTNTDRFAGIEEPSDVKEVLYWLFDNDRKAGDVSDVFSFPTRHVVMKVETAKHIGFATLEDVRSEIEPIVRQEMKGKKIAEKLEAAIAKAKNPNDLSKAVNGLLIPADDLRMGQRMIPQLNAELKILGAVFGSEENKFSKPIIGKEYTAVVYVTKRKAIEVPKSVLSAPDQYAFMNSGQFMAGTLDRTFKKQAKIQDYRYKFEWF